MSDPKERAERTGSGGSSDGDTQPDDTGATGTLGDSDDDNGSDGAEADFPLRSGRPTEGDRRLSAPRAHRDSPDAA